MTKNTKIILGIVIVVAAIGGIWLGVGRKAAAPVSEEEEVIKIGVILPLTGKASIYGEYIKNGIELAIKEINNSNLQIIYEDSQCDPKQAIFAYHSLVDIKGVRTIIGGACSPCTLSIAPLAEKDKVILFTPASSAASISNAGDYIFRNHVYIDLEVKTMIDALHDKYNTFAMIYDASNDGCVQGEEFLRSYIGNDNLFSIAIQGGSNDFRTNIIKLKENIDKIDAIYLEVMSSDGIMIVKQMKELGINKPIIADKACAGNKDFVEAVGYLAEGILYAEPEFNYDTNNYFWDSYVKDYAKEPVILSAQSYDILKILYDIIENKCDLDSECIKNTIYVIDNYHGAAGNTSFNEKGDAIKHLIVKTIKGGQFVPYEENE